MGKRGKILVQVGAAYLLYSMVYHGASVSMPLFLVMLALVVCWRTSLKVFGRCCQVALFFLAFLFFRS